MTRLRTLNEFMVGDETSEQGNTCKLRDLKALVNLRGELTIHFSSDFSCDVANYQNVELIRALQLKKLRIQFTHLGIASIAETLLGSLQPHNKLKVIEIQGYNGLRLPTWVHSLTTSLPNLVEIKLDRFERLEILPLLSQLRHLKYLVLWNMPNVEFMEDSVIAGPSDDELIFFPSLEKLRLFEFPKLKGWWREEISRVTGEVGSSSMAVPSFPSLLELNLIDCPSLATFPACPKLFKLDLYKCHETLTFFENKRVVPAHPGHPTTGDSSSLSSSIPLLYLDTVTIDNIRMLDCLFGESLGGIRHLSIQFFEGESLSTLSGIAKHFTSLQSLSISNCESLESLPEWINCLTSLQTLRIQSCSKLKSLPEAIARMPALQALDIINCDNLNRR